MSSSAAATSAQAQPQHQHQQPHPAQLAPAQAPAQLPRRSSPRTNVPHAFGFRFVNDMHGDAGAGAGAGAGASAFTALSAADGGASLDAFKPSVAPTVIKPTARYQGPGAGTGAAVPGASAAAAAAPAPPSALGGSSSASKAAARLGAAAPTRTGAGAGAGSSAGAVASSSSGDPADNETQEGKARLRARPNPGRKSEYRGVSWQNVSEKWVSQFKVDGQTTYLGLFVDDRDAAKAYDICITLRGLRRRLNFAPPTEEELEWGRVHFKDRLEPGDGRSRNKRAKSEDGDFLNLSHEADVSFASSTPGAARARGTPLTEESAPKRAREASASEPRPGAGAGGARAATAAAAARASASAAGGGAPRAPNPRAASAQSAQSAQASQLPVPVPLSMPGRVPGQPSKHPVPPSLFDEPAADDYFLLQEAADSNDGYASALHLLATPSVAQDAHAENRSANVAPQHPNPSWLVVQSPLPGGGEPDAGFPPAARGFHARSPVPRSTAAAAAATAQAMAAAAAARARGDLGAQKASQALVGLRSASKDATTPVRSRTSASALQQAQEELGLEAPGAGAAQFQSSPLPGFLRGAADAAAGARLPPMTQVRAPRGPPVAPGTAGLVFTDADLEEVSRAFPTMDNTFTPIVGNGAGRSGLDFLFSPGVDASRWSPAFRQNYNTLDLALNSPNFLQGSPVPATPASSTFTRSTRKSLRPL